MSSPHIEHDAWVIDDVGRRAHFEDSHFLITNFMADPAKILCGVFDGHSGRHVADLAARRFPEVFQNLLKLELPPSEALRRAYLEIDKESIGLASGAVAVTLYIDGRELYHANAGDSDLLLVSGLSHHTLSESHRLNNQTERTRVIESGAEIHGPYIMLPSGSGLQCTRSLGDHDFKIIGVIPDPFLGNRQLGPDDLWLIAGSDGLWDFMMPAEVATISRKLKTARAVGEALRNETIIERRGADNLTVLTVRATR